MSSVIKIYLPKSSILRDKCLWSFLGLLLEICGDKRGFFIFAFEFLDVLFVEKENLLTKDVFSSLTIC